MEQVMDTDILVLFVGNIGSAVLSWLATWFMLMVPYFWMVDHVWTDGELPPVWVFLLFVAGSLGGATLVSKATYRLFKRCGTAYLANKVQRQADARVAKKMQTKYPHLVKYMTKP